MSYILGSEGINEGLVKWTLKFMTSRSTATYRHHLVFDIVCALMALPGSHSVTHVQVSYLHMQKTKGRKHEVPQGKLAPASWEQEI